MRPIQWQIGREMEMPQTAKNVLLETVQVE